jgi:hypothetical protein
MGEPVIADPKTTAWKQFFLGLPEFGGATVADYRPGPEA